VAATTVLNRGWIAPGHGRPFLENAQALVTFVGVQKTYDGTKLLVPELNLEI